MFPQGLMFPPLSLCRLLSISIFVIMMPSSKMIFHRMYVILIQLVEYLFICAWDACLCTSTYAPNVVARNQISTPFETEQIQTHTENGATRRIDEFLHERSIAFTYSIFAKSVVGMRDAGTKTTTTACICDLIRFTSDGEVAFDFGMVRFDVHGLATS